MIVTNLNMKKEHDILFKPIIWAYIKEYNKAGDAHVKKKLKEGLKDTLKKWSDQKVKMISKSVYHRAQTKYPEIDPFELMWPQRNKMGKVKYEGKNPKSWLVWEHTTPLAELFETLIKCTSETDVSKTMKNYSGVCWISRKEDDLLNKNKYRSKRPGGWKKCYKECGIYLVSR